MDEKKLIELRNSKINEMEAIVNLAKEEQRTITNEEKENFEKLEKEIKDIDNTIEINNKAKSLGLREIPEIGVEKNIEDLEREQFENIIRNKVFNVADDTTKADGEVTIPTTIAQKIIDRVIEISPIFARSERYNVPGKLEIPKYDKDNSSIKMEYADEGTDAEGKGVKLINIELTGFLGRCLAKVSKSLINNSQFNIVDFVIEKISQAVAVFIETECLTGTDKKIEGLRGISEDMIVTSQSATSVIVDELIDVQDKVIDSYQENAIWIMNRLTRSSIRKLKDNDGNLLLNRDVTSKWGYTLLGKDVYTTDAVKKLGAGNDAIFYGDFSGLATKVSEDINILILREKYAEQHMDGILAFIEMDAKVQDTQKISKLTCKNA